MPDSSLHVAATLAHVFEANKQWPIMGHKPKYRRFQCQHSTSSLVRSHPSPIPGRPPLPSILIGFSRKHYSSSGIAGSYIENLGPCNYITARTTTPRSVHPPSGLLLHSIHPTTVSSLHNFFFFFCVVFPERQRRLRRSLTCARSDPELRESTGRGCGHSFAPAHDAIVFARCLNQTL